MCCGSEREARHETLDVREPEPRSCTARHRDTSAEGFELSASNEGSLLSGSVDEKKEALYFFMIELYDCCPKKKVKAGRHINCYYL